jgi:hypothetical protein
MLALVAGAAFAVGTDVLARRASPQQLTPAAVGLVGAAVVYPAARAGRPASRAVAARENIAVVSTAAVAAAAATRRDRTAARRLVAAGWASHALFDAVHDRGPSSRLPGWYPAVCAGYDLALAGLLLRR